MLRLVVRTTGRLPVLLLIVMARVTLTFTCVVYVCNDLSPALPAMTLFSMRFASSLLVVLKWPVT